MFHFMGRCEGVARPSWPCSHGLEARATIQAYQLILWRIFHFWWRFLLPILRLRLGFAIIFSIK
jgi:hypothetical protein